MYYYNPITDLGCMILILGIAWLLWKHLLKVAILRAKYVELYKITKLEEELKERNLSLEKLDNVEERILGLTPTTLKEVDERYSKNTEKKAK